MAGVTPNNRSTKLPNPIPNRWCRGPLLLLLLLLLLLKLPGLPDTLQPLLSKVCGGSPAAAQTL
jgi:hypothetical protein